MRQRGVGLPCGLRGDLPGEEGRSARPFAGVSGEPVQAMDNGEADARVAQWADVAQAFGHFGDPITLNLIVLSGS